MFVLANLLLLGSLICYFLFTDTVSMVYGSSALYISQSVPSRPIPIPDLFGDRVNLYFNIQKTTFGAGMLIAGLTFIFAQMRAPYSLQVTGDKS
jgi:hypothetical protein